MLRDRYYLGFEYDGIEYPGRHEPLIEPELFDRVQRVLYVERGAGTRQRHHEHYLKRTIWRDRCTRRLILRPSTSKTGRQYFYFICRGVQARDCDLPALPVWKVEKAVEAHYTHIQVPHTDRETIEHLMNQAAEESQETTTQLRTQLTKHLKDSDAAGAALAGR
jgi:site-specific DNA recombinase